jgi:hypothetical protein
MFFRFLCSMTLNRCRWLMRQARSRGCASGTGLLVWLAALVCAVPAWAAPVVPSATGELDDESRPAVTGRSAQRTGPQPGLSSARTFDILVEMQDRSAGLGVGGGVRAYGGAGQLPAPTEERSGSGGQLPGAPRSVGAGSLLPQLEPAGDAGASAQVPQGGLFGSGALPMLPQRELSTAPVSTSVEPDSGRDDGTDGASGRTYRSGPGVNTGFRPMEGSGDPGLLHTLLSWVRENRAMVAAAALALLVLVWGTGMAVTQQSRR